MGWVAPQDDPRLIPVHSAIQALRDRINDLEWDGVDATFLRDQLENLEAFRASGDEYIPTF